LFWIQKQASNGLHFPTTGDKNMATAPAPIKKDPAPITEQEPITQQGAPQQDRSLNAFNARKEDISKLRAQFNLAMDRKKMLNDHDFTAKVIEQGMKYYARQVEVAQNGYISQAVLNGENLNDVCSRLGITPFSRKPLDEDR
jgi:hypothetical protein